jgi:hypothetical protein
VAHPMRCAAPCRAVPCCAAPTWCRGKVNAADSVRTFSWSGSAALGGILVEKYGFESTFLITAGIKCVSFLPLLLLFHYVADGVCAGARAQQRQADTLARAACMLGAGWACACPAANWTLMVIFDGCLYPAVTGNAVLPPASCSVQVVLDGS